MADPDEDDSPRWIGVVDVVMMWVLLGLWLLPLACLLWFAWQVARAMWIWT